MLIFVAAKPCYPFIYGQCLKGDDCTLYVTFRRHRSTLTDRAHSKHEIPAQQVLTSMSPTSEQSGSGALLSPEYRSMYSRPLYAQYALNCPPSPRPQPKSASGSTRRVDAGMETLASSNIPYNPSRRRLVSHSSNQWTAMFRTAARLLRLPKEKVTTYIHFTEVCRHLMKHA